MPETIVLVVDDLMFLPRLKTTLHSLGYQTIAVTNETELTRALFRSPILAIVDLFNQKIDWVTLIGLVKTSKAGPVPVLGFGPHVDLSLREKALAAGCDAVVGRGAITTNLAHLVEKHKWVLDKQSCAEAPPLLLLEGLKLFNLKEYFECHEAIEQAWMAETDPVRIMYQGILQIGVACYHIQNKNWRGAMKLLERGIPKVERFSPYCMGIDLAKLLADAELIRQALIHLGPAWQGEFNPALWPKIRFEQS